MDNLPLFVLGIPEDLSVVKAIIPHDLIRKEFVRPLSAHVSNVISTLSPLASPRFFLCEKLIQ